MGYWRTEQIGGGHEANPHKPNQFTYIAEIIHRHFCDSHVKVWRLTPLAFNVLVIVLMVLELKQETHMRPRSWSDDFSVHEKLKDDQDEIQDDACCTCKDTVMSPLCHREVALMSL